jgi:myosin heavy subunit
LAENSRITTDTKVQEAEQKVQEAVAALSVVTSERDTLQTNAETASEQLTAGIKQVQDALNVLGGAAKDENDASAELEETKAALAAATSELDALKAQTASSAEEAAAQLQQAQDALAAMTSERDALQAAVDAAAEQAAEFEALQENLAAITAQRDELLQAAENAKVSKTSAVILDAEEKVVAEFENVADLKLDALQLEAGVYTIRILVYNAANEEAARYDLPYLAIGASTEEAVPAQEEAVEEKTENDPAAETEEAPAEGTIEEAPAEVETEEPEQADAA